MSAGTLERSAAPSPVDAPPIPVTRRQQQNEKRAQRRATPLSPVALTATWMLRGLGLLAVWLLLFGFVLSGIAERRSQAIDYATLRLNLAQETTPIAAPIAAGTPISLLDIPRLGLRNLVVVEGATSAITRRGPGHLPGTVLPAQPGVSVVYGRSTLYGAPFGKLTSLGKGDPLTVTTGEGTFTFHVIDVRRRGQPLPAPVATGAARLVLASSAGGSLTSSGALFVDADMTSKAAGAGAVGQSSAAEALMAHDSSQLPTLLIWLEGLLLGVIGGVWGALRWGRWQTWLIAGPLALAMLWGATNSAALLLPNLF